MKKTIKTGLTNISYFSNQKFVQIKIYNKTNHKINYKKLKLFDFVPKLIANHSNKIIWEKIHVRKDTNFSNLFLIRIAKIIKKFHHSKLKFPDANLINRIDSHFAFISKKRKYLKFILNEKKYIYSLVSQLKVNANLHNDLWLPNILNSHKKIYFVDWEYASKGDYHFDLGFFIEENSLNLKQEKIFLKAYGKYDKKQLLICKVLFNFLTILWLNSQTIKNLGDNSFYYYKRYKKIFKELKNINKVAIL